MSGASQRFVRRGWRGARSVLGRWRGDTPPVRLHGHVHPDFTRVADALRAQLRDAEGGAAACVYHRGECVVDVWGGWCDESRPWQRDTMAPSFSTTKGVASTLIHVLRDQGRLDYDDRVAKHWPEFAQAGKSEITIRQVMSHQSGLYHIRQMIDRADRMLDWEHMIHAIERAEPAHTPGTRTGYHGLTYGFLVGEIAQRVTNRPFPQLVHDLIAEPLDLDGMYIGAPKEALARTAQLFWPRYSIIGRDVALPHSLDEAAHTGAGWLRWWLRRAGIDLDLGSILDALAPRGITAFDFGAADTLAAAIPAAGGLFTARSLARMYALLAGGGKLGDTRLMSRDTVALAGERQDRTPRSGKVLPFDLRWRLGYHGVWTTAGSPRQAFGHFGFGGSGAWADPHRNLAVALIVNSGMGTPFGDLRIVRVGGAALRCAIDRTPDSREPAAQAETIDASPAVSA